MASSHSRARLGARVTMSSSAWTRPASGSWNLVQKIPRALLSWIYRPFIRCTFQSDNICNEALQCRDGSCSHTEAKKKPSDLKGRCPKMSRCEPVGSSLCPRRMGSIERRPSRTCRRSWRLGKARISLLYPHRPPRGDASRGQHTIKHTRRRVGVHWLTALPVATFREKVKTFLTSSSASAETCLCVIVPF